MAMDNIFNPVSIFNDGPNFCGLSIDATNT